MDETTKIIIATLSGFFVAFFAEPVKLYFQNRNTIQNLRIALYKEIFHNYVGIKACIQFAYEGQETLLKNTLGFIEHFFRRECYKQSLTQNLTFFYQLREATTINHLYMNLDSVFEISVLKDSTGFDTIPFMAAYLNILADELKTGNFDRKLMSKIAGKKTFDEMCKQDQKLKDWLREKEIPLNTTH